MRKDPMPFGMALALLLVGIFLGCIFSFGMQYWNDQVTRKECIKIETHFLGYDEIRQPKRPAAMQTNLTLSTVIDLNSHRKELRF